MRLWLALASLLIPNALELCQVDPHNPPCWLGGLRKVPDWRLSSPAVLNQTSFEELAPYAPVNSSTADIIWWWCIHGLVVYSSGGHANPCVDIYTSMALLPLVPFSQQLAALEGHDGLRQSLQHWLTEFADRCEVCLPRAPPWVLPSSNSCHWRHDPQLLGAAHPPAAPTPYPFLSPHPDTCPRPDAAAAGGAAAAGQDETLCPAVDWDWPWKAMYGFGFGVWCVILVAIGSALRLVLLAAAGAVYGCGTAATRLVSAWGSLPEPDQGNLSRRAGLHLRAALLGAWDNLRGYLVWCVVQYLVPEVVVSLGCLVLLVTGLVDPLSMLMKHLVTSFLVTLGLAKLRFGPRLMHAVWWGLVVVARPAAAVTRPVWGPVVVRLAPVVTPPAMAAWHWLTAHFMRGPVLTICIELQRSLSWAAGGEEGLQEDVWQDALDPAGQAAEEDPDDDLGEDLAAEDGRLLEAYGEALQWDVPDWPHGDRDQSTVTCRVCGSTPHGMPGPPAAAVAAGAAMAGVGPKQQKFLVCAQCHSPQDSYCSLACMEEDWPRHRRTCQPPLVWTELL